MTTNRLPLACAALAATAGAAPSHAQHQPPAAAAAAILAQADMPAAGGIPPDVVELGELRTDPVRAVSFYAGVDVASKYISRGLVFADEFSVQPWAELDLTLTPDAQPDGPIDQIKWFVGTWNNVSDNDPDPGVARTGRRRSLESWYEADIYTGVRVGFLDHAQASLRFNYYTSPSDSFEDIHEIDLRLAYDDSHLWSDHANVENFSLTPRLRVAKETRDEAGPEQWYFEPSLTPSLVLRDLPLEPRVSVPLVLGFGAAGKYVERDTGDERTFGHFRTGLAVEAALPILPEDAGVISLRAAVDVIILADERLGLDDDPVEPVFRFGVSYAF